MYGGPSIVVNICRSLLAVIPVTYFGGHPSASKPRYIAVGMFIMGTGSLLFASPHFIIDRF